MNKISFNIAGFKCFLDSTFILNNLTVLTGANASGKSSVIQALLLIKAASESEEISLSDSKYAFDMGDKDSLVNENSNDEVSFTIDNNKFYFLSSDETSKGKLKMYRENKEPYFNCNVFYLSAERQGPRFDVKLDETIRFDCGCHGEEAANALSNNEFSEIDELKQLKNGNFSIQLDAWIDTIFPGVSIKVMRSGETRRQIMIRNNQVISVATNVGFGISYALPIIIEGLLARKGDWLIVENPEAHLHAKAQSNMGYFLSVVAAAGVRVILETHSEHIVNGIRRAAMKEQIKINQEDINIYFMSPEKMGESKLITIDNDGSLSDFPVDFFDQSRQDLLEIINLSSNQ